MENRPLGLIIMGGFRVEAEGTAATAFSLMHCI